MGFRRTIEVMGVGTFISTIYTKQIGKIKGPLSGEHPNDTWSSYRKKELLLKEKEHENDKQIKKLENAINDKEQGILRA